VILLDEADRVLLLEFDDPNVVSPHYTTHRFWSTPGGGIEAGESIETAARRELWEETGIQDAVIGNHISTVSADLLIRGEPMRFINHMVVARVINPTLSFDRLEDYERSFLIGHRWWSYEELIAESADVRPFETVELIRGMVQRD
jgi:8-oxo-dGTP pyrophosphatase MutT (NUDIX family)